MGELLYLNPNRLRMHPQNMRRIYPAGQVGEMAGSIKANAGVQQALLIVPDAQPNTYLVVDGNLRLAAGQSLGQDCPPLKCEVIDADHAQQLMIMAVTTAFHFAKDPISEALHYRRLIDEGYKVADIIRHTGLSHNLVTGRLHLLDLDREIQDHVAAGRLSKDRRVADALLSIADREARIKLASGLANRRASIETSITACKKLVEQMAQRAALKKSSQAPALTHARITQPPAKHAWGTVRAAAHAACQACNIHEEALANVAEPAWELVTHAAEDTCAACNLRLAQTMCDACPAVELLRRLQTFAEAPIPVSLPQPQPVGAARARR